jgi:hypothetical protein
MPQSAKKRRPNGIAVCVATDKKAMAGAAGWANINIDDL